MSEVPEVVPEVWELEIDFYVAKGWPRDWAEILVVNSWMYAGDLRPLRAHIKPPGNIDPRIVSFIVKMLDEDRLTVRTGRRGAGSSPEKFCRDIGVALFYKEKISSGMKSDDAFGEVAQEFGLSADNVRKIWTWFNKWNGK
jgi:hypothetical protein